MIKKFLLAITILILGVFLSGCDNEKPQVLYNTYPFTKDTIMSNTNFLPRGKIYYLITLPKVVESRMLYIQILKTGGQNRLGYELVWGNRVHLKTDQIHYYTDYVVLNASGTYVMRIYSQDNPTKILTTSEFHIK